MKKGTIIRKKQITLAVMVLALAAAVWLNMKYSATSGGFDVAGTSSERFLGQTEYVNTEPEGDDSAVAVSANGYFATARANRDENRKENVELLQETVAGVTTDDAAKAAAVAQLADLAKRVEDEAAIETLIKAKGVSEVIAVIGDDSVNIIVEADELLDSEVQQIKDIVIGQTGIGVEKIKIMAVK